jgi:hypothetical protein
MARFRRAINTRMEEMSFRSGAFAVIGVLVAAGLMIALIVTLSGHSAASASASGPGAGMRSVASSLPAASASAAVPASPSARAKATAKATRAAADQNYEAPAKSAAVPRTSPSQTLPAAAYPHPHHRKRPILRHAPRSFPIFWFPGL